ncbi:hypothetical protein K461DRAFT_296917 [Myriangium duriaei CBS 260.36]|uniref:VHS domain-containing protein n=1 Tax=Myriangium duriaei CBS 260.36 TaxID=1168546 RepID=A0A9P4IVW2_9PEZI|nr:hypothetical protein K461DRAFT_296917 [Myriangium duriaei CBS 260.36]
MIRLPTVPVSNVGVCGGLPHLKGHVYADRAQKTTVERRERRHATKTKAKVNKAHARKVKGKKVMVKTPTIKIPKVKTPKIQAPRIEAPRIKTPKVKPPKVKTPEIKKFKAKASSLRVRVGRRVHKETTVKAKATIVEALKDDRSSTTDHSDTSSLYLEKTICVEVAEYASQGSRPLSQASSSSSKKPYTAVSVQIDRMTSEQFDEDDLSGIIDLIEVIRIQSSGPTEAARALRKKLKYGSQHRQLRALAILDGLIQNAGSRFQKTFADEPLLERLRIMARDDMVDVAVRQKCNILFRQWAVAYKDTPGLQQIAALHKQLPQPKRRPQQTQTKSLRETELEAEETTGSARGHSRNTSAASASGSSPLASRSNPVTLDSTPRTSLVTGKQKKNKQQQAVKFNLERERPEIMQTIAQASVASTNLLNALQLINREHERVSENREVLNRFETCKNLRRLVLRYIQLVEGNELIGSLLSANDELVKALSTFDIMDRSLEDDSDSDAWEDAGAVTGAGKDLAGLKLKDPVREEVPPPKPARPVVEESESEEEPEDDPNDPFGDAYALPKTPGVEKQGMTWQDL